MDPAAALRGDTLRPFVTLATPGGLLLLPFWLAARNRWPAAESYLNDHQAMAIVLAVSAALCAGMFLEAAGSLIETYLLDRFLLPRASSFREVWSKWTWKDCTNGVATHAVLPLILPWLLVGAVKRILRLRAEPIEASRKIISGHQEQFNANWQAYLQRGWAAVPVGQRYLSTRVVFLKFELSMAIALPTFVAGLRLLVDPPNATPGLVTVSVEGYRTAAWIVGVGGGLFSLWQACLSARLLATVRQWLVEASPHTIDRLSTLHALRTAGALTEEEFAGQKHKLLQ